MDKRHKVGKIGENTATRYLIQYNYDIVEKNYKCKYGEIDIIAYDKNIASKGLVFVEVKTRSNKKYGVGVDAIDKRKQCHIYKTAEHYLYTKKDRKSDIRIDCIEIFLNESGFYLKHYFNIILEPPF